MYNIFPHPWVRIQTGGGVFESDHLTASVHGTQFGFKLFESNPAHISAVLNAGAYEDLGLLL